MSAVHEESLAGRNVICFTYALGQRVWIVDAESWGRVKQMCAGMAGREYQVAYFDEDKRRQLEWMGEDEVRAKP